MGTRKRYLPPSGPQVRPPAPTNLWSTFSPSPPTPTTWNKPAAGPSSAWPRPATSTGIIDLTAGRHGHARLARNSRVAESEAAAKCSSVTHRENLHFPDARLENSMAGRMTVAHRIRELRPKTVILPYWEGRHPDHYRASEIGYEACFLAGLKKDRSVHRTAPAHKIVYSSIYANVTPSFVVDISRISSGAWNRCSPTARSTDLSKKARPFPRRAGDPRTPRRHRALLRQPDRREIRRALRGEGDDEDRRHCRLPRPQPVSELRWHPLLREWVSVAAARQNRPQMPKDWCPFCPGSGKVPTHYDTLLYPNDFAAFSPSHPPFEDVPGLFAIRPAPRRMRRGPLSSRPQPDAFRDVRPITGRRLWNSGASAPISCSPIPNRLSAFIFENTGEAIGVTMPHPHGQIYALPLVPPLVQRELDSARTHRERGSECLYCRLLADELTAESRIVIETEICRFRALPREMAGRNPDLSPASRRVVAGSDCGRARRTRPGRQGCAHEVRQSLGFSDSADDDGATEARPRRTSVFPFPRRVLSRSSAAGRRSSTLRAWSRGPGYS
jgi:hypothetical protein